MKYEDIYSRSYMKKYDPQFYHDNKDLAYVIMKEWMHEIGSIPYVRKAFKVLSFDDILEELTYELVNSIDEESDDDFVKKIFSDGFVICWMRPKVDSINNLSVVIGDKETKRLISNYGVSADRLEKLEIKLKKYIRDYGYINGMGTES